MDKLAFLFWPQCYFKGFEGVDARQDFLMLFTEENSIRSIFCPGGVVCALQLFFICDALKN